MELRWYQKEAIEAIWQYLRDKLDNPCVVLPTGAGKGNIIAAICHEAISKWGGRILVATHVKELIDDTSNRIQKLCPFLKVGVYSAAMKRRDTTNAVIVGGIHSIYDKADQLGMFDLMLVDEAHLIPDSGDGMYRQLIRELLVINPELRVIGLTATPYRLSSGPICTPDGILNAVCYEVGVKTLIAQGFLCKLIGKNAVAHIDSSKLKTVRGEFDQDQVADEFSHIIEAAVREIVACTVDRKSVLIFTSSIAQGEAVASMLRAQKGALKSQATEELSAASSLFELIDNSDKLIAADWLEENGHTADATRVIVNNDYKVGEIYGNTEDRDEIVRQFKAGEIKYLVNVNVLTTGFDATNVDCVCLMRSSVSPGLVYQMIGRAFRIHEGKKDALILDFGENIARHGPVDDLKPPTNGKSESKEPPAKMCPNCRSMVAPAVRVCPDCQHEFEMEAKEPKASFQSRASIDDPISDPSKAKTIEVVNVKYSVHTKKDADASTPKTLRVDYYHDMLSFTSEWVCLEHKSGTFPHTKASKWWKKRCIHPMPSKAIDAVQFAEYGLIANCTEIQTKQKADSRFPEIVDYVLDARPVQPIACDDCDTIGYRCIQSAPHPHAGKITCGGCGRFVRWATSSEVEHFGFVESHDPATYKGLLDLDDKQIRLGTKSLFDKINEATPHLGSIDDVIIPDDLPF